MKICSVIECEKQTHAHGMCHSHYLVVKQQTAPKCSELDCDKPSRARGMCNSHYEKDLRAESSFLDNIDYDDFWEFVKKERRIGMPNAKRI
jgi:hypothetical protein